MLLNPFLLLWWRAGMQSIDHHAALELLAHISEPGCKEQLPGSATHSTSKQNHWAAAGFVWWCRAFPGDIRFYLSDTKCWLAGLEGVSILLPSCHLLHVPQGLH